jgi:hypothetical protein
MFSRGAEFAHQLKLLPSEPIRGPKKFYSKDLPHPQRKTLQPAQIVRPECDASLSTNAGFAALTGREAASAKIS